MEHPQSYLEFGFDAPFQTCQNYEQLNSDFGVFSFPRKWIIQEHVGGREFHNGNVSPIFYFQLLWLKKNLLALGLPKTSLSPTSLYKERPKCDGHLTKTHLSDGM